MSKFETFGAVGLAAALVAAFIADYLTPPAKITTTSGRYEVEAVYLHSPSEYSVTREVGGELRNDELCGITRVIADAATGQKAYVDFVRTKNDGYASPEYKYVVHVHGVDEINTAGWDHGKFGSGFTHRVD